METLKLVVLLANEQSKQLNILFLVRNFFLLKIYGPGIY